MTMEAQCPTPEAEMPRERLRRLGADALSDHELLALVLGTGRPNESVLTLAGRLLADYAGARGLLHAGVGELAPDIGFARAARLAGALELARRGLATAMTPRSPYTSSSDVVRAFAPRYADRVEEHVVTLVLDARNRVVAERELARGGPAACRVGVRDVFALAVREGGSAVLVVHNHPSGDPSPSHDDFALTRALADAGRVLELPLLDHVIVSREGSFSFLDAGLLAEVRGGPTRQAVTS